MQIPRPADVGGDRRGAGLDPAVIAIHHRLCGDNLTGRIPEKPPHIVMQAAVVALQRHDVVPLLVNHLLGDGALAVGRIDGDGAAMKAEQLQQLRHRCWTTVQCPSSVTMKPCR
jgi:hypothetical protein